MVRLSASKDSEAAARAKAQFDRSDCMSDNIAALASLVGNNCRERDEALSTFHAKANGDALVLNKWFAIQAMADTPNQIERVKALKQHKDFLLSNPNRCRPFRTGLFIFSYFSGKTLLIMTPIIGTPSCLNTATLSIISSIAFPMPPIETMMTGVFNILATDAFD